MTPLKVGYTLKGACIIANRARFGVGHYLKLVNCPHLLKPRTSDSDIPTMPSIPWSSNFNFTSALLLHSCTTILLKETLNWLEITRRLLTRLTKAQHEL